MGTRGLIGFIQHGVRQGTYNHWDSYPSGLGDAIINFIMAHTEQEWDEMAKKVSRLEWIDENQGEVADSNGHHLLERIWNGNQIYIVDETEFLEDGLFCEYAYFIDFESKILEVEGVVEDTLEISFKDLKVGVIDEKAEQYYENRDPEEKRWKLERMIQAVGEVMGDTKIILSS